MTGKINFEEEFKLVTDTWFGPTINYLSGLKQRERLEGTMSVPTHFGALFTPDEKYSKVFSTYTLGKKEVVDVPPQLNGKYTSAETGGVGPCGVIKLDHNGYRMLAHECGPKRLRILVARGLYLAQEKGMNLSEKLNIELYCNPDEGWQRYLSGDESYKNETQKMAKVLGLDLEIKEHDVHALSRISV